VLLGLVAELLPLVSNTLLLLVGDLAVVFEVQVAVQVAFAQMLSVKHLVVGHLLKLDLH
jgi:hypothetical protein